MGIINAFWFNELYNKGWTWISVTTASGVLQASCWCECHCIHVNALNTALEKLFFIFRKPESQGSTELGLKEVVWAHGPLKFNLMSFQIWTQTYKLNLYSGLAWLQHGYKSFVLSESDIYPSVKWHNEYLLRKQMQPVNSNLFLKSNPSLMYEVNPSNFASNILSFQLNCFAILPEIFFSLYCKKLIKWTFYWEYSIGAFTEFVMFWS